MEPASNPIDPAPSPVADAGIPSPEAPVPVLSASDHWHELLSTRYVCEACLTRYFMKYRKCKACGQVGRIRLLTATLFELADDDGELREMIANGQRMLFDAPQDRESP